MLAAVVLEMEPAPMEGRAAQEVAAMVEAHLLLLLLVPLIQVVVGVVAHGQALI